MSSYGLWVLDDDGAPQMLGTTPAETQRWGKSMSDPRRILARTQVGALDVSTVFLGLDHNFFSDGLPVLWETMTFGDDRDRMMRYTSAAEALDGHRLLVESLRAGIDLDRDDPRQVGLQRALERLDDELRGGA